MHTFRYANTRLYFLIYYFDWLWIGFHIRLKSVHNILDILCGVVWTTYIHVNTNRLNIEQVQRVCIHFILTVMVMEKNLLCQNLYKYVSLSNNICTCTAVFIHTDHTLVHPHIDKIYVEHLLSVGCLLEMCHQLIMLMGVRFFEYVFMIYCKMNWRNAVAVHSNVLWNEMECGQNKRQRWFSNK